MRKLDVFVFIGYVVVTVAVFVAALVSPPFRTIAYAPLRELVMPPPPPIVLSVLYSTEKEQWLAEVVPQFEASNPKVDGRPVKLEMAKTGSREMYLAVLNGEATPDVISPASSLQISLLEDLSAQKPEFGGQSVVDGAACRPTVRTPLTIVIWRERADVLWGDAPNGNMWKRLHDAVVNPEGWKAFGDQYSDWGLVDFGHTDPLRSNSGFMTILSMTYNYFGKTSGLTSGDILDADFQSWLVELERSVPEFGASTGTYMKEMVAYGPSKYELVAVYESTAIEQAENAEGRYGELRVYYPPATVWSDHPFCVLDSDWVAPEKREAAQLFIDFLLSRPAQELAIKHGFRPEDRTISLDQPGSPFVNYAPIGIQMTLPTTEIEVPPGDVLDTLLNFWSRSVGG
jgi:ABC-type Fe3+ transport system substrate-binding protein